MNINFLLTKKIPKGTRIYRSPQAHDSVLEDDVASMITLVTKNSDYFQGFLLGFDAKGYKVLVLNVETSVSKEIDDGDNIVIFHRDYVDAIGELEIGTANRVLKWNTLKKHLISIGVWEKDKE